MLIGFEHICIKILRLARIENQLRFMSAKQSYKNKNKIILFTVLPVILNWCRGLSLV